MHDDRKSRGMRWKWVIALVLGIALLQFLVGHGQAQNQETADGEATSGETSESTADERIEVLPTRSVAKIEDTEEETTGLVTMVDKGFEVAVEGIKAVLFYRLGSSTEEYVVVQPEVKYVRPRASEADFRKLTPDGLSETETIAPSELATLFYRDALIEPVTADDRYFRYGKLDGKEVEYLRVRVPKFEIGDETLELDYGRKYVKQGDKYVAVTKVPDRDALDPDATLTASQVEALGAAEWLEFKGEEKKRTYKHKDKTGGAPVVVIWLAAGAIFFTLYMRGFNIWGFGHAVQVVRGKYDNPTEEGEVSHFQALASALSATVGLGNIAGVTIAMTIGGPGAFFWMICCGLFGMTSKFTECTLGQKYRTVKPDGTVLGGPMVYLKNGLAELGLVKLGVVTSLLFTVMCILASFGGGNMFQINQSGRALLGQIQDGDRKEIRKLDEDIKAAALANDTQKIEDLRKRKSQKEDEMESFRKVFNVGYGLLMAFLVGIVIIGGIKRIGAAAEKIVPTMCIVYVLACLWIIFTHLAEIPALVSLIFTEAFNATAIRGGIVGVLVVGVQRAAFSNEAGVGSAAIAHSAARTKEPVREGAVALLGPFIDTIIVCSMTALVILITGAWNDTTMVVDQGLSGANLTSQAFGNEISWFPWVLSVAVVLFAFSTVISWSYYGERCTEMLFGPRSIMVYKVLAVACVFLGAIVNAGSVLDFSDMMILSMAFPNVLGVALLAPKVRRDLVDYWRRYKAGEFETFK